MSQFKYSLPPLYASRSRMIRRLVLDVLKPHNPGIVDLSKELSELDGVEGVNIITYEIDQKVENVKIILGGSNIDFKMVREKLESLGAVIHSVDEVAAGTRIVEEVGTPQDKSARL